MLAFENFIPTKVVDGAVLRGSHQPSAGIVRDARLRPTLERRDESILRKFFGHAHVADNASEAGDQPGRLNPPDRIDRGMCHGGRHAHPSPHLQIVRASRPLRAVNTRFFYQLSENKNCCYGLQRVKSSGLNIWRTSVSPSQPGQYFLCSSIKRTALSTASSLDFNSNCA